MERAKGEALGRVFAVEFSFSTARSFNVLSSVTILVFFTVVPMDWPVGLLRIERFNSRKGSNSSVHGRGAAGSPRVTSRVRGAAL